MREKLKRFEPHRCYEAELKCRRRKLVYDGIQVTITATVEFHTEGGYTPSQDIEMKIAGTTYLVDQRRFLTSEEEDELTTLFFRGWYHDYDEMPDEYYDLIQKALDGFISEQEKTRCRIA